MKYKIIIAGGRQFRNYAFLKRKVRKFIDDLIEGDDKIEIVSGGANGADQLGERFAREFEFELTLFPADWGTWGPSAGYKRNKQMAKYATACICFWDGKSKGTKHIDLAREYKLILGIFKYTPK